MDIHLGGGWAVINPHQWRKNGLHYQEAESRKGDGTSLASVPGGCRLVCILSLMRGRPHVLPAALKMKLQPRLYSSTKNGMKWPKIVLSNLWLFKIGPDLCCYLESGKKNLENYQLPKWSLPKDYLDFGFVSGNIFILFSIYIFVALPYPDPTPSVWELAIWASYQVYEGWAHEDKSGFHYWAGHKVCDCSWLATFL